jgi:hypothetical protein
MIYIITFIIFCFGVYIVKNISVFKSLYRIYKKLIFPKKYTIPKLSQYEFPLPPFPNTWYPICLTSELKRNTLRKEKIAGREFILYRSNNNVAQAISKNCSHMGVELVYGHVENDCVVCPFHHKRNKPNMDTSDEIYFIEEVNNVIFIWISNLRNEKPEISVTELMKQYTSQEKYMFSFSFFKRIVGGSLVDYAEHLLDNNHTLYIHGVHIDTQHTLINLSKHSFSIKFKIKDSYLTPNFTYITPTFGFIEYTENIKVYIMFVIRDVGCIEMIILPNGNSIKDILYSFMGSLYTFLDFSDESAFFSTKAHNIRNLLSNEIELNNFRKWFKKTFYEERQIENFEKNKIYFLNKKELHDW